MEGGTYWKNGKFNEAPLRLGKKELSTSVFSKMPRTSPVGKLGVK